MDKADLLQHASNIMTELDRATAAQKEALEQLFDREADVRDSTRSLKERESELIIAGLEGSNDKQRAAYLFEATPDERGLVTLMEENAAKAKLELQKADLDLKLAHAKARLVATALGAED